MLPIQTILHPTDFSAPSECAFRMACSLAADYGAQLILVHVVSDPELFGNGLVPTGEKDEVRRELGELDNADSQVDVVRHLEHGRPATAILHLAQLANADLIVMGTHGRCGLSRLLMGSVAEEVVRRARCPVLTIRGDMLQRNSLPDLRAEPTFPRHLLAEA